MKPSAAAKAARLAFRQCNQKRTNLAAPLSILPIPSVSGRFRWPLGCRILVDPT